MTHADKVREAERAVVSSALAFDERGTAATERALLQECSLLRLLRAATCPTCGGEARVMIAVDPEDYAPCPAGCDNGRRVKP